MLSEKEIVNALLKVLDDVAVKGSEIDVYLQIKTWVADHLNEEEIEE